MPDRVATKNEGSWPNLPSSHCHISQRRKRHNTELDKTDSEVYVQQRQQQIFLYEVRGRATYIVLAFETKVFRPRD